MPLEKLTVTQQAKKSFKFYSTRRYITMFITACCLSLSTAKLIPPMPHHPTSFRCTLILFFHLCLGLVSFLQVSLPKFCTHLSSLPSMPHATSTSFNFDYPNNAWQWVEITELHKWIPWNALWFWHRYSSASFFSCTLLIIGFCCSHTISLANGTNSGFSSTYNI